MKRIATVMVTLAALAAAGCTEIGPNGETLRSAGGNAALSLLVAPGVGQFCNEQYGKGAGMLIGSMLLWSGYIDAVNKDDLDTATAYLLVNLGLTIWSAADAYHVSNEYNKNLGTSAVRWDIGVAPVPEGVKVATTLTF